MDGPMRMHLYTRWLGSDGCSVLVSVEFMVTYL